MGCRNSWFDTELAQHLADLEVIAVGSDTYGLDVIPPVDPEEPFQGHVILLQQNGIYILEAMNTGPLAKDGTFEFLFVLGQAKVRVQFRCISIRSQLGRLDLVSKFVIFVTMTSFVSSNYNDYIS